MVTFTPDTWYAIGAGVIVSLILIGIITYALKLRKKRKKDMRFDDLRIELRKGYEGLQRASKTFQLIDKLLDEIEENA